MIQNGLLRMSCALACIMTSFVAMAGDMSNSIEYDHLYIVGGATDKGWDLGSAYELEPIDRGVFRWTGELKGGEEFKFMNTREAWHKHITAAKPYTFELNGLYDLNFFADWTLDGSRDLKFTCPSTAEYEIIVDLNRMKVTFGEAKGVTQIPSEVTVTGSAIEGQSVSLCDYGVEFKGSFHAKPGFVRLQGSDGNHYGPLFPEVDLTAGMDYPVRVVRLGEGDEGWSVGVEGDYTVYFDKSAGVCKFKRFVPVNALYITGGCCRVHWNYDDPEYVFVPSETDPRVMVWEGELRIGWDKTTNGDGTVSEPAEPDLFKILTARDWFRPTYHPYSMNQDAIGETDARISGGDDYKWKITRDGRYRMEFNLITEKLKVEYSGAVKEAAGDSGQAAGLTGVTPEAMVRYYSLSGYPIEKPVCGTVVIMVKDGRASKVVMR